MNVDIIDDPHTVTLAKVLRIFAGGKVFLFIYNSSNVRSAAQKKIAFKPSSQRGEPGELETHCKIYILALNFRT